MKCGYLVATLCPLMASTHAAAVDDDAIQRIFCTFDKHVTPEAGVVVNDTDDPMNFIFMIDASGYAMAVGQNLNPVQLITGYQGMTFLEILETGAVQSTTIHNTGNAVHSRHTMLSFLDDLTPSQYYGTCHSQFGAD